MSAELRDKAGEGAAISDAARSAELIARIESVPFSRWHIRPRVIMGSATFFDAFTALSLASATPVLVQLWGLTLTQVGYLLAASYIGQFAGALIFGWLGERIGTRDERHLRDAYHGGRQPCLCVHRQFHRNVHLPSHPGDRRRRRNAGRRHLHQ
jgi:hypothetical protein